MDQREWSVVNGQLRQHGLPPVDVVYAGTVPTPTVVLTIDSAKVLHQTLLTLMKDGDRRRDLLQEMLTINNQLREELKAQTSVSHKYEDRAKELQADLNESYARLQEFELNGTGSSFVMTEERPKQTYTHSKLLQLQQKCDLYEKEIDRLTMKLRKVNEEGSSKRSPRGMDLSGNQMKKTWKENRNDTEVVYQPKLYRRVDDSSREDITQSSSSTDSETISTLRQEIKSRERNLSETKQKLKTLETENEKMKLELLSRPQAKDLRDAQLKIKQLQSQTKNKDRSFSADDEENQFSTLVGDLPRLPVHVCRKHLKRISEETGSHDLNHILPKLEQWKKAAEAFPQLEKFAKDVLQVIDDSELPFPAGYQHRSVLTESHQIWCERTWYHVLPMLEFWVTQLKQLKELQLSLKNLAERLLPWKPVRLEEVVTTVGLIEFVDSLVWEEDENEMTRRIGCCKIHDEPVSKSTLEAMVRHFQMLFDVPRICGMYAKMSEIYRRLKETHNIMLNLKEFLGLDETAKPGAVVDAVASLCEMRSRHIEEHLANLFQTDDVTSIVKKIEEQDELLSAFDDIINRLMTSLNVQSLDEIVPTVSRLTGMHSS